MKIYPVYPFSGKFLCPADKSETLRTLLLSAFTKNEKTIVNPLIAGDTHSMQSCLTALGATFSFENGVTKVTPIKKIEKEKTLDAGNSGTTARLLLGTLAGLDVPCRIIGDASLSSRSLSEIIEPLTAAGAVIESDGGRLPVRLVSGIKKELFVKTDSAQVKGGVLLAGYFANVKATVEEVYPTRDVTERLLSFGGASVTRNGNVITLDGGKKEFSSFTVGGDASSAAYFMTLGLVSGETTVKNVALGVGREGFLTVARRMGGKIELKENEDKTFDITSFRSDLIPVVTAESEAPSFIDELPLLAVLACFAKGKSVFKGLKALRNKECDRLSETVSLISSAGGKAYAEGDSLVVEGSGSVNGGFTYGSKDHRMTMTAAILMRLSLLGGEIFDEDSVKISFAGFFETFKKNPFALIGEDVRMSLSYLAHKQTLDIYLDEYSFSCVSLKADDVVDFLEKAGYKSINVTNPYKITVYDYLKKNNRLLPEVESVNLVYNGNGYNTDLTGLKLALMHEDYDFNNKKVLVYGSGGVSRSVCAAFHELGCEVYITARNTDKAREVVKELPFVKEKVDCLRYEVLANASAVGRVFAPGCPFDTERISLAEYVFDVNYEPVHTPLLTYADDFGVKHSGGLKLLFYQALVTDAIYLGKTFDKEVAAKYYREFLLNYENLTR